MFVGGDGLPKGWGWVVAKGVVTVIVMRAKSDPTVGVVISPNSVSDSEATSMGAVNALASTSSMSESQ